MPNNRKSEGSMRPFLKANEAWEKGDLGRAFGRFSLAAIRGDPPSQLNLGYFFDRGIHVKKDKAKAMYWYYQAYRSGDASGANNIATLYREERKYSKMLW